MEETKLTSAKHTNDTRNSNGNKSTNDWNYTLLRKVSSVGTTKTDEAFSLPLGEMGIEKVQKI